MVARWRTPGLVALLTAVLLTLGCGSRSSDPAGEDVSGLDPSRPTTSVTLPDGAKITAELALTPEHQARGLMFRRHLRADEGMLFPFSEMSARAFWMFQTVIPLDIVWLDDNKRIVYISERTPPCRSSNPADCPNYGEGVYAAYVLELGSGRAGEHGLKVGDALQF